MELSRRQETRQKGQDSNEVCPYNRVLVSLPLAALQHSSRVSSGLLILRAGSQSRLAAKGQFIHHGDQLVSDAGLCLQLAAATRGIGHRRSNMQQQIKIVRFLTYSRIYIKRLTRTSLQASTKTTNSPTFCCRQRSHCSFFLAVFVGTAQLSVNCCCEGLWRVFF